MQPTHWLSQAAFALHRANFHGASLNIREDYDRVQKVHLTQLEGPNDAVSGNHVTIAEVCETIVPYATVAELFYEKLQTREESHSRPSEMVLFDRFNIATW